MARQIFERFPHADCYSNRSHASVPGTIDIRGNGSSQRLVANLHAQFAPGRGYYTGKDSKQMRVEYFRQCLHWLRCHIMKTHKGQSVSIGFPARIGCGLGGGDWSVYIGMIERFARTIKAEHHQDDTTNVYYIEEAQWLRTIRDERKIYKF